MQFSRSGLIILIVMIFAFGAWGQNSQAGIPSFSSQSKSVNLGNLNYGLPVKILSKQGRGIPVDYMLHYNSTIYVVATQVESGPFFVIPAPSDPFNLSGESTFGWNTNGLAAPYYPPFELGFVAYASQSSTCSTGATQYTNFVVVDIQGTVHPLPSSMVTSSDGSCGPTQASAFAADQSGYRVTFNSSGAATAQDAAGNTSGGAGTNAIITDRNGNFISGIVGNLTTTPNILTDTLGANALSFSYVLDSSGNHPVSNTYTYPAPGGANASVVVNYRIYPRVASGFGCPATGDFFVDHAGVGVNQTPGVALVDNIVLADGSKYSFVYEPTPTSSPNWVSGAVTGRLQSVTLPTGGTISYGYPGPNGGINCTDGTTMGLTVTTMDGTTTYTRSISSGGSAQTTTVTDPQGNQTVVSFVPVTNSQITPPPGPNSPTSWIETQRQIYQGGASTGTLLQTLLTCYNGNKTNCNTTSVSFPITEVSRFLLWPNGQENEVDTFLSSTAPVVTEVDEYDFGSNQPGPLLRKTVISYAAPGHNILDRPQTITVCSPSGTDASCNGSGTRIAQTTFSYDETALTQTTNATNHDYTNYGSGFTQRGNPTTIKQWVSGTTFSTTTNTYDDLGNLRSTTDPGGHTTTFDYSDSYSDGVNHNTQAFVTTTTHPSTTSSGTPTTQTHIFTNKFYWPSAVLYQATDENSQTTTYSYNNMFQPLSVNYPDGGHTDYTYFPAPTCLSGVACMVVGQQITANTNTSAAVVYDGLGRAMMTRNNNSGESGGTYDRTDTCYDGNGRVSYVSYPYQGAAWTNTSHACSGAGDSFTYDALGRRTSVTHSDGTSVTTTYTGRAVKVQDEGNGSGTQVTRISQQDGLGRTATVCEVAGSIFNASVIACGLDITGSPTGVTTSYTYDLLGNVTQISQGSLITRAMTYDGLSRLLTETIPEQGGLTTRYTYFPEGMVAARTRVSANQSVSCIAQSNCTTSTTNYNYDALHRPLTVSYSDTPSENTFNVAMFYDYPFTGTLGGYNVGRLTYAIIEDKNFANDYQWINRAYDKMGRLAVEQQALLDGSWHNYTLNYTYNLLGLPVTSSNGEETFTYTYNGTGRPTQMTSSLSDASHPGTLFSTPHYNAFGELTSDSLGNGVNETFGYDARGRLLSATIVKGTTTIYSLGGPGTGNTMTYTPDSGLAAANDSVNGNFTYSYDALNRMAGANKSGGTNLTFDIDRDANRWHQNPTGQGAQLSFDSSTNHVASGNGVTYDAAGNIINDGNCTYTYDAEYRITSVGACTTANYEYDAFGRRSRRQVGSTAYQDLYDGSNMVTELRISDGMWMRSEMYLLGRHLATYTSGGTYFSHSDWLGTERVRSDWNGNSVETCTSNPYGDNYSCTGTTDPSPIKYAGMEYDSETQLYHTQNRYYNPRLGLWMTPDPAGLGSANPSNPQSWNRYAYVMNNPINARDPSGLCEDSFCFPPNPFGGGITVFPPPFGGVLSWLPPLSILPGEISGIPAGLSLPSPIQVLLADLPWNKPCVRGVMVGSDLCGFGFGDDYKSPYEYVAKNWFGTTYCGPGPKDRIMGKEIYNKVKTVDGPLHVVDEACKRHDMCYSDHGLTAGDNWNPFLSKEKEGQLHACNQALCDAMVAVSPWPDGSKNEKVGRASMFIWDYFTDVPMGSCGVKIIGHW